jgi:hypothetical protein
MCKQLIQKKMQIPMRLVSGLCVPRTWHWEFGGCGLMAGVP